MLYINIYMYIYIYIYKYVCMYIYIFMHAFMYVHLHMYVRMLYIYIQMYIYEIDRQDRQVDTNQPLFWDTFSSLNAIKLKRTLCPVFMDGVNYLKATEKLQ